MTPTLPPRTPAPPAAATTGDHGPTGPRARRTGLLLALLATLWMSCLQAAPPSEQWFTVLLDGRKVGSYTFTRAVQGETVVTTQALALVIDRAGNRIALTNTETATETLAGAPLAFGSTARLSGTQTGIEGRVADGRVTATLTRADAAPAGVAPAAEAGDVRRLAWPSGALLPEGMRLQALREGLAEGTRYRTLSFQPSSLAAAAIETRVGAAEQVDLPGGSRRLVRIDQTITLGDAPLRTRTWVDADLAVQRMTMPILGTELILLACDRACATAPNQPVDLLARTSAPAPRALAPAELDGTLRYHVRLREGTLPAPPPTTDEQSVRADDAGWRIDIHAATATTGAAPPTPADRGANDWLQSDAPEIRALAERARGDATDAATRMQRSEAFVRAFITTKSLGVGYASALEVARHPEGDCTEHALLLAALGRASGIPTRIAYGLAYAPDFGGKQHVFVPHAWAQAWVDGRWQSYDAALAGFDAGHITLAVGDGDPWRFYSGLGLLGGITIERIEALPDRVASQPE